ncbi:hypothetical protein SeLEV6574_g08407 [Synchytrium endobioticum]|nr:hypothetical protein SeLEV6574_g08407 [Synchytrium endobioticum]
MSLSFKPFSSALTRPSQKNNTLMIEYNDDLRYQAPILSALRSPAQEGWLQYTNSESCRTWHQTYAIASQDGLYFFKSDHPTEHASCWMPINQHTKIYTSNPQSRTTLAVVNGKSVAYLLPDSGAATNWKDAFKQLITLDKFRSMPLPSIPAGESHSTITSTSSSPVAGGTTPLRQRTSGARRLSIKILTRVFSKHLPQVPVIDTRSKADFKHVLSPPLTPVVEKAALLVNKSECTGPIRQHCRSLSLDSSTIKSMNITENIHLAPRHASMLPSGSSTPIPLRAPGRYSLNATHSHLPSSPGTPTSGSSCGSPGGGSHRYNSMRRASADSLSPIGPALHLLDQLALAASGEHSDNTSADDPNDAWTLLWRSHHDMPRTINEEDDEEGEDDSNSMLSWKALSDDSL